MKSRLFVFLLIAVSCVVGVVFAESGNTFNTSIVSEKRREMPKPSVIGSNPYFTNKTVVINGAENPELIPDTVAYSLMFRFISGDQSVSAKKRIRSYVELFGTDDQLCNLCQGQMKDADIDAIIAVADEYQRRVTILDGQAEGIKRNNPQTIGTEAMIQLKQLQHQKDVLITEIVSSLPKRLSSKGLSKLQSHITKRVKGRTKYKPNTSQDLKDLSVASVN
jgi:hypothetical protein